MVLRRTIQETVYLDSSFWRGHRLSRQSRISYRSFGSPHTLTTRILGPLSSLCWALRWCPSFHLDGALSSLTCSYRALCSQSYQSYRTVPSQPWTLDRRRFSIAPIRSRHPDIGAQWKRSTWTVWGFDRDAAPGSYGSREWRAWGSLKAARSNAHTSWFPLHRSGESFGEWGSWFGRPCSSHCLRRGPHT